MNSRSVSRSRSASPAPLRKSRSGSASPVPPGRRRVSPSRSPSPTERDGSKRRRVTPSRSRSFSPRESRNGGYERSQRYNRRSRSPVYSRRRPHGNREDPEPSKCIGVFGLSIYTTKHEL